MEPKVSVIVPIFNVEKYLRRCLDSITGQTYKNLEILLINDGSTDNSGSICEIYVKKDTRVHYYEKANGGLSDARNYGLRRITGNYVAFIDSDDCLSPVFFEVLIKKSLEYNADIVSSDLLMFYDDSELPNRSLNQEHNNSMSNVSVFHGRQIISQYLCPKDKSIIYDGLCMKVYRKELFDNLFFEFGKVHEDLYITYQLLYRANCLVIVNDPLYFYFRNNRNSITNNYSPKNYLDECDGYFKIIDFFSNKSFKGDLNDFGCKYLFYATVKAADFINDPGIQSTKECVSQWVKKNVFSAANIPLYKKIIIFCMIDHVVLYRWLRRRIKGDYK